MQPGIGRLLLFRLRPVLSGLVLAALVPVGYPAEPDHLGGSIRHPIAEVTFNDRWGNRPSA